jgi:hemerythrin-like domain-containing protein
MPKKSDILPISSTLKKKLVDDLTIDIAIFSGLTIEKIKHPLFQYEFVEDMMNQPTSKRRNYLREIWLIDNMISEGRQSALKKCVLDEDINFVKMHMGKNNKQLFELGKQVYQEYQANKAKAKPKKLNR